jgi:hypothetical protein
MKKNPLEHLIIEIVSSEIMVYITVFLKVGIYTHLHSYTTASDG